jgi:hypothetical protein
MQDFPVRSEAKDLGKQTRGERIGQSRAVSKYLDRRRQTAFCCALQNLGFNCYRLRRAGLTELEPSCMETITTISGCRIHAGLQGVAAPVQADGLSDTSKHAQSTTSSLSSCLCWGSASPFSPIFTNFIAKGHFSSSDPLAVCNSELLSEYKKHFSTVGSTTWTSV